MQVFLPTGLPAIASRSGEAGGSSGGKDSVCGLLRESAVKLSKCKNADTDLQIATKNQPITGFHRTQLPYN